MSLSYELAKELKEAGFPLTKLKDYWQPDYPHVWGHFNGGDGLSYVFPTLSELIEACGDNFDYLVHTHGTRKNGWYAESGLTHQGGGLDGECIVSTPEEAVARLWLALNK